jgi:hypothetical protein
MRIECDNMNCDSVGEIEFDVDGQMIRFKGPFQQGDRKSGYPVMCLRCGSEVYTAYTEEDDHV